MLCIDRRGMTVHVAARARLTDDSVRRARACLFYLMKESGYSSRHIATLFRVSRQLVNAEIRAIPEPLKRSTWRDHLGPVD